MHERRGEVRTEMGSRYLQQLCKHWGHRFPVDSGADYGEIALPLGPCRLQASDDSLVIVIKSGEAADLARLQEVVEDHLRRFAFREELDFDWRPT
jgi:hypothetical protein